MVNVGTFSAQLIEDFVAEYWQNCPDCREKLELLTSLLESMESDERRKAEVLIRRSARQILDRSQDSVSSLNSLAEDIYTLATSATENEVAT